MPRSARGQKNISGMGGHLQVRRFTGPDEFGLGGEDPGATEFLYAGDFVEVRRWRLRQTFVLAETTGSGSNGAITRAMVAQDSEFWAELIWNSRLQNSRDFESVGFLEEIMLGQASADWNVSILFAMGDSLQYPDPNTRAAKYLPEALINDTETINDGTGAPDSLVKVNIHGFGNALVQSLRGLEVQFNSITDPAEPAPPNPT